MTLKTLINRGAFAFDPSADDARDGAAKLNALVAKTYVVTAQQFGGTTKEATITATIAAAVADGADRVFLPALYDLDGSEMLPYDATKVTFNTAVRVIWEGGDPGTLDARAYGFSGNGSSSDAAAVTAITAIVNSAAFVAGLPVYDGAQLAPTPFRGHTFIRYASMDSDANPGVTYRGRAAGGTPASPSATVGPGNVVTLSGHTTTDGTSFTGQGEIVLITTEAQDASHRGTAWNFRTTKAADTVLATRWQIDNQGNWVPGTHNTYDVGSDFGSSPLFVGTVRAITVRAGKTSTPGVLQADGDAATNRDLIWTTANARRWHLRADSTAESGSNAGTNLFIRAYDDSGATIDDPLTIFRAAGGGVFVARPLKVLGGTSTTYGRPVLALFQQAGANTTSTSDTSITSYTLGGNSLNTNGNAVRILARGRQVTQGGSFNVKFGATVLATVTPAAGETWEFDATVARTGATAQLANIRTIHATTLALATAAPAETLSGDLVIDFRGSVTSGGTLDVDYASIQLVTA